MLQFQEGTILLLLLGAESSGMKGRGMGGGARGRGMGGGVRGRGVGTERAFGV